MLERIYIKKSTTATAGAATIEKKNNKKTGNF